MKTFFEIITGIFLFLSIIVGLFIIRGEVIFSNQPYTIIKNIMFPGYLVITGLVIGKLIASIWLKYSSDENKAYNKSFITGILIGVILALMYMFI